MSTHDFTPVENRSEIIFAYDAVDANPNGNPLSGSDEPRIDTQTQQCVVTDVRLKRYIRDQLDDDGHGIFIRSAKDEEGNAPTREAMMKSVVDVDSPEDVSEDIFDEFLAHGLDARMFGATLAISTDEDNGDDGDDPLARAIASHIPSHLTGPIQFSPGRSINSVVINEEYNSLTSVIGTQEGKREGGYDLDDNRIKYGFITFHGRVDEHGAKNTNLSVEDVARLDTTCWRAIKNQTTSRSKMGQEPRLYIRVEYDGGGFHIGDLHNALTIDRDHSEPDAEMRNIRDVVLSLDELHEALSDHSHRIDTIHVNAGNVVEFSHNGEVGGEEFLYETLEDAVGYDSVHRIDVYEEYKETMPESVDVSDESGDNNDSPFPSE